MSSIVSEERRLQGLYDFEICILIDEGILQMFSIRDEQNHRDAEECLHQDENNDVMEGPNPENVVESVEG